MNLPEIGDKWFVLKLVLCERYKVIEWYKGFGQGMLIDGYIRMQNFQNTTYYRIETKIYLEVKHQD